MSYTTVARRVTRLETALDQVLFFRQADGYFPTEAAHLVASHAARMQVAHHDLQRALAAQDQRLHGTLVITAPQLMIAHVLAPVLADFRTQHPDVDLQTRATNDLLDLTRREADLAIRISDSPGDTLMGVRAAAQETACFGTKEWADRYDRNPDADLDWIVYHTHQKLADVIMKNAPGSRITYRFDDMVAMAGAAQAGLGIVRMPLFLGRVLPGLVQIPIMSPQPYTDIWVVAHPDVWPSARVTAFRDILVPYLKQNRDRFVG